MDTLGISETIIYINIYYIIYIIYNYNTMIRMHGNIRIKIYIYIYIYICVCKYVRNLINYLIIKYRYTDH